MYAYNAWKRWAIDNAYQWRRWASDIFASLTLGELWTQNGTVAPPLVLSCAGQVCSNGTCPACSVSPAEMTENIRANLQRHNQTKSCSLCGERSSLLLGYPMPCCRACSDQAEALGLFVPHRCHGVGGLPCPHGGSRDGTHLLCRRCLGEQACKRPGGMVCPYEGLREGTPGVQVRGPSRVGSLHIGLLTSDARRPRLPLGRAHHARRIPRAFSGSGSLHAPRERLRARGIEGGRAEVIAPLHIVPQRVVIIAYVDTMWPSAPFHHVKKTPNLSMGSRF